MIRGFATNRVLLAIDGVRMNTAIFRSGNVQNVISLDPLATEKTEIIFGPGSVIYGSDAIGGVMSFYTLTPKLSEEDTTLIKANAVLRTSSANFEKTGHLDFSLGIKKWGFVTSASFTDYDDLRMGSKGPKEYLRPEYVKIIDGIDSIVPNSNQQLQVPTGYQQVNLMQKIRFNPNEYWDVNYGLHFSTTSDYGRYDRLVRYKKGKLRSAEWYYGPQTWLMNTVKIIHTKQQKLFDQLGITLAHQYFKESRHDRDYRKVEKSHRTEEVNAFSLNVDLEKALHEKHTLFYGIDVVSNLIGSEGIDENMETGIKTPGSARYPDGSTWTSFAGYANHRFRVNEKVSFQSGIRYNQILLNASFDTTFFKFPFKTANINTGAVTGSLGLAYNPLKSLQININASTGFRAPNIDDVGKIFDSEPGAVVVPNPNLKSEYAYNAEVGIAKVLLDAIKLDITAYYTLLDNALVRRDYSLNSQDSIMYEGENSKVQAIQNAAKANVYGIQTGVEIKLPYGFGTNSRFNYQLGEEELGDGSTAPLRHSPPWFGSSHVTYNQNRLKVDIYMVYNGEISHENLAPSEKNKDYLYALDKDGNTYSPMWHTFNFKTIIQATDNFLISLGVENIGDLRYKTYASGLASSGRNFIASIKASL